MPGDQEERKPGEIKRILQWNCDGIMTKITELKKMLQTNNIDICCLQETKLNKNQQTPKVEGYEAVRCDRNDTNSGAIRGGVLCWIRKGIPYQVVQQSRDSKAEIEHINIYQGEEKSIELVNIYLPPFKRISED